MTLARPQVRAPASARVPPGIAVGPVRASALGMTSAWSFETQRRGASAAAQRLEFSPLRGEAAARAGGRAAVAKRSHRCCRASTTDTGEGAHGQRSAKVVLPSPGPRSCNVALLGALAWLAPACALSFDIAPSEIPNIKTGTVRTIEGDVQPLPEQWKAEAKPRGRDGTLMVVDPVVREVRLEKKVRFGEPFEAGLAPLGAGVDASRGEPLPSPQSPFAVPGLWLRDNEGRIVEIPLSSVDHVHVWEKGLSAGGVAGLVTGIVVGAAAVAAIAAAPFVMARNMRW